MGDDMHFEVLPGAEKDELICNMEGVPLDDSNLVIKVCPPSTKSCSYITCLCHGPCWLHPHD
jgi:hypothetical protein